LVYFIAVWHIFVVILVYLHREKSGNPGGDLRTYIETDEKLM
jgi:hypothetical protein